MSTLGNLFRKRTPEEKARKRHEKAMKKSQKQEAKQEKKENRTPIMQGKFATFIKEKVASVFPDIAQEVLKVVPGGGIASAIATATGLVKEKHEEMNNEQEVSAAEEILKEIYHGKSEWLKEQTTTLESEIAFDSMNEHEAAALSDARQRFADNYTWLMVVVACAVVAIVLFFAYALFFREIPETNRELVVHYIGLIEGVFVSIVVFYFGSSRGSRQKSNAIVALKESKSES